MFKKLKNISFFIILFALSSFTSAQVGIGNLSKSDSILITSVKPTESKALIYVKGETKITIGKNTSLKAKIVYLKEQPKRKQIVLAKKNKNFKKNKLSDKLEEFTKIEKVKLLKPKFHLQQGNLPLLHSSTSGDSTSIVINHHDQVKKYISLNKKIHINYFTSFYLNKNVLCFGHETIKDTGFTNTCGIRPPPTA